MGEDWIESDSHKQFGGAIPGTPARHAFYLTGPNPSAIPVLIAVPHAGRDYPRSLLQTLRSPEQTAMKLEDRYVDRLGIAIAQETGASLLIANAPRAMVDLNRAPDDIDWGMFGKDDRAAQESHKPNRRARSGLGLIPRRVPGLGELWKQPHREEDLSLRIEGVHAPYHAALSDALSQLRARWGAAVLLDLHSMPPIPAKGAARSPEYVLGDRFRAACHGSLAASAFSFFHEHDRIAAHNRPYSGGYVLDRHASPQSGIHAMQLEIDRRVYLDTGLSKPGGGFAVTAKLLSGLVRKIAAEVTLLGEVNGNSDRKEAAE